MIENSGAFSRQWPPPLHACSLVAMLSRA